MNLSDVKSHTRTQIKTVPGGPPVGTVGSNRAAGVISAIDKVAEFASEGLANKQGAVIEQVGFSAYGASNDLPRTLFDKYVRLTTSQDAVLNLPDCTLSDVGRIIVLYNYNGPGSDATQTLQATLGTDASATLITTLPRKYVAMLEVVKLERGTPQNDTVATYAVLANGPREPQAYATLVNGQVPADQLPASEFLNGTYTVKAADVTNPASDLVIQVPGAIGFGDVAVAVPGGRKEDLTPVMPNVPGGDYQVGAQKFTILASLNPPLQEDYVVYYSYITGTVTAGYTDVQARAAQLGLVAPAGTTTILLTSEAPTDYGTLASSTFTIDAFGCVVGKVVRFGVGPGAGAPFFNNPPAGQPFKYLGASYVSGRPFSYSLLVCVDRIEVITLED